MGGDLETAALSRLFLLGLVEDPAERRAVIDGIIAEIERELAGLEEFAVALDAQAATIPDVYRDVFRFQRATLDYGVVAHRASLDWFATTRRGGASALTSPPGQAAAGGRSREAEYRWEGEHEDRRPAEVDRQVSGLPALDAGERHAPAHEADLQPRGPCEVREEDDVQARARRSCSR